MLDCIAAEESSARQLHAQAAGHHDEHALHPGRLAGRGI